MNAPFGQLITQLCDIEAFECCCAVSRLLSTTKYSPREHGEAKKAAYLNSIFCFRSILPYFSIYLFYIPIPTLPLPHLFTPAGTVAAVCNAHDD